MSLKSIINSALDAAKKFIAMILPSSKHLLDVALSVVNGIKTFDTAHPEVGDFITSIIPGNVDDYVLARIRSYLPYVLIKLRWVKDESDKTEEQILADAAKFLSGLLPAERAVMLQALWQLLSNEITDNAVDIANLQKIGQVFFESSVKGGK